MTEIARNEIAAFTTSTQTPTGHAVELSARSIAQVELSERNDLDIRFPSPPTNDERDSYLSGWHRWIPFASAFGAFLTTASMLLLVHSQPWAIPLMVPLGIALLGLMASLTSCRRKPRDTLMSHRTLIAAYAPSHYPSVDVFLPSAGEDLSVLENTYKHVQRLQWKGRLRVYVLDDSARESVADLAERYGFDYSTRPNRGHLKKAGNLLYGYQRSDGEHIAIFDADFVPRSDYLANLMPYTADDQVGIVQSPQYFDSDPQMNWVQYAAGATQVLFYRWVQSARDRSNAAICVGTCAIYRRRALQAAGGFAQIEHSEDVHTGVKLTRAGFRVRYVPIVVAKGLCPDTLDQFVNQQYRWCAGSMSLLFSRAFHRTPLSVMQRVCYWSGFLYYIDTAVNVFVVALAPILMAVLAPDAVTLWNYVLVYLALAVRLSVVPVITMGRESLIGLARIQVTYSFAHALALRDVLRGRTDAWQATGVKKRSPTAARARRLIIRWCVLVQALTWSLGLWRAWEYGIVNFAPMMLFGLLNLAIVYPLISWRTTFPRWLDPMTSKRTIPSLVR